MAKDSLHPQVVEQLHEVMTSLHAAGDLISPPNTFPSLDGVDLPVHETAEAYVRSGGSFLSRMLPYWAVRWVWRLQIVVLPLLAVGLPTLKFLPQIYRFWGMRTIKTCYHRLREVETHIDQAETPDELRRAVAELETLRTHTWAKARRISAMLQPDIYQWRTHVAEAGARAEEKRRQMAPQDS